MVNSTPNSSDDFLKILGRSERMLQDAEETLQNLLANYGGIDPEQVDILFALPTPRTVQGLTGPTILFSQIDLWENLDLRNSGFEMQRNGESAKYRSLPRYFDLKYLVSVFASSPKDENAILSRLVWTLYRHQEIPAEVLPKDYEKLLWRIRGRLVHQDEGPRPLNIWSDLGSSPRPALLYILTLPLDVSRDEEVPLVLTRAFRTTQNSAEEVAEERRKESERRKETPPKPSLFAEPPGPDDTDADAVETHATESQTEGVTQASDGQEKSKEWTGLTDQQERVFQGGLISYGGTLYSQTNQRLKDHQIRLVGPIGAETKTKADGKFLFHRLVPGDYMVEVVDPDGEKLTFLGDGRIVDSTEEVKPEITIRANRKRQEHFIFVRVP